MGTLVFARNSGDNKKMTKTIYLINDFSRGFQRKVEKPDLRQGFEQMLV